MKNICSGDSFRFTKSSLCVQLMMSSMSREANILKRKSVCLGTAQSIVPHDKKAIIHKNTNSKTLDLVQDAIL